MLSHYSRCQFHHQFTSSFVLWMCYPQLFCTSMFVFVIFWPKETVEKTAHKMLMKLNTGVSFTNNLWSAFSYEYVMQSILTVCICSYWRKDVGEKASYKMLMKLTLVRYKFGAEQYPKAFLLSPAFLRTYFLSALYNSITQILSFLLSPSLNVGDGQKEMWYLGLQQFLLQNAPIEY